MFSFSCSKRPRCIGTGARGDTSCQWQSRSLLKEGRRLVRPSANSSLRLIESFCKEVNRKLAGHCFREGTRFLHGLVLSSEHIVQAIHDALQSFFFKQFHVATSDVRLYLVMIDKHIQKPSVVFVPS